MVDLSYAAPMTPPRLDPDAPQPPATYHVDRAADGQQCEHPDDTEHPAAVVIDISDEGTPYCMPCWGRVSAMLERNGHRLIYTNAALALWERPGVG